MRVSDSYFFFFTINLLYKNKTSSVHSTGIMNIITSVKLRLNVGFIIMLVRDLSSKPVSWKILKSIKILIRLTMNLSIACIDLRRVPIR